MVHNAQWQLMLVDGSNVIQMEIMLAKKSAKKYWLQLVHSRDNGQDCISSDASAHAIGKLAFGSSDASGDKMGKLAIK